MWTAKKHRTLCLPSVIARSATSARARYSITWRWPLAKPERSYVVLRCRRIICLFMGTSVPLRNSFLLINSCKVSRLPALGPYKTTCDLRRALLCVESSRWRVNMRWSMLPYSTKIMLWLSIICLLLSAGLIIFAGARSVLAETRLRRNPIQQHWQHSELVSNSSRQILQIVALWFWKWIHTPERDRIIFPTWSNTCFGQE